MYHKYCSGKTNRKKLFVLSTVLITLISVNRLDASFLKSSIKGPKNLVVDSVIVEGDIRFSATDSVRLDRKNNLVKLFGGAIVTKDSLEIRADYIEYDKVLKSGIAKNNVTANFGKSIKVATESFYFDFKSPK